MKILVVEDEVKLADAIVRALVLQQYVVDVLYQGRDVVEQVIAEQYDVLLFDVMLPDVDGIELCRRVRGAGVMTPIILLTAKGQIHDKVVGLDAGADDYLTKPFAFEELFSRLRALSRRPHHITTELRVGNVVLDSAEGIVRCAGSVVSLSAKEFALLEYLLRNKNHTLSKARIVQYVWGDDAAILPSTVEVHIKHIRDKLRKVNNAEVPMIETVRGFGYVLRES